jgi:hypothetical protein
LASKQTKIGLKNKQTWHQQKILGIEQTRLVITKKIGRQQKARTDFGQNRHPDKQNPMVRLIQTVRLITNFD